LTWEKKEEMTVLTKLSAGEEVRRYKKSIVIPFNGKRKVLSTAPHNGGYREDLTAVFNSDCTIDAKKTIALLAPTYREHMALLSVELGLDPETSAGLLTSAQMENVSIKTEAHNGTSVTAIVTGGIDKNGGRAGDPAPWDELAHLGEPEWDAAHGHGTVNIMLFVNTDLTGDALARSLITSAEAKTAAIQELLAPSRYSMGLATGSGTDGAIIVANADSDILLANAGKHSKLGELIGRSVKAAVKEALYKQTGLGPESQRHVLSRVDRFGITRDSLWKRYMLDGGGMDRGEFERRIAEKFREHLLVIHSSLYAHLVDQLSWGLISPPEAEAAAEELIRLMGAVSAEIVLPGNSDNSVNTLVEKLSDALLCLLRGAHT
jgi:adenosylcobinamide amidohydrolase